GRTRVATRSSAPAGAGSRARERRPAARARRGPRPRGPSVSSPAGERGEVPEDRREVPVAEEQHREGEEHEREAGVEGRRAWADEACDRDHRAGGGSPAQGVVEKGCTGEEPGVLLMDEERGSGDDECARECE